MGFVELAESAHADGVRPVRIHYREAGRGRTVVFLHGGWGYGVYPIERQVQAFGSQVRFFMPDRSRYGQSSRTAGEMPVDFHQRAARETLALLDALAIRRAIFWGHSDGAVIAAMIALTAPERCERLVLEAFHYYKNKPASRRFFERFSAHPEHLGEKTQEALAADHGRDWREIVSRNCAAWMRIADGARPCTEDLYDGQLGRLAVPAVFVHGALDPRTEAGEMEAVRGVLPRSEIRMLRSGQHSPHSEPSAWWKFNAAAAFA